MSVQPPRFSQEEIELHQTSNEDQTLYSNGEFIGAILSGKGEKELGQTLLFTSPKVSNQPSSPPDVRLSYKRKYNVLTATDEEFETYHKESVVRDIARYSQQLEYMLTFATNALTIEDPKRRETLRQDIRKYRGFVVEGFLALDSDDGDENPIPRFDNMNERQRPDFDLSKFNNQLKIVKVDSPERPVKIMKIIDSKYLPEPLVFD